MKGLIFKDLLLIKGNQKSFIIILFGFFLMSLNNVSSISFIIPFFCTMMCISTFSYDDYNKWDAYAIALPKGRINVVKSKYIATLLLVLISSIISIILTLVISSLNGSFNIEETLSSLVGGLCGILILISIMYPLIYKFGPEKGRLFLFVGVFLLTTIGGMALSSIDLNSEIPPILSFIDKYGFIIFPTIVLIVQYVSYLVSLKIYSNKEF